MRSNSSWLAFALVTTVFWGIWGALIELPEQSGFPATLGYVVWSLTMIPPAVFVLSRAGWALQTDKRSVWLGCLIGLTGAGGQLVLFETLRIGPAYLVFPIISLSPVITIALSIWFLTEKTGRRGWIGIALALIALPLLSYSSDTTDGSYGLWWLLLSLLVLFAWGLQAYVIKRANTSMTAESIFFYMMLSGLFLIPVALYMTDFSVEINWGLDGPVLTAGIQVLNAIGALCLVYAFRYGKAIIVAPLTNAVAPVITILLSLTIYSVVPISVTIIGMVCAVLAAFLFSLEEE